MMSLEPLYKIGVETELLNVKKLKEDTEESLLKKQMKIKIKETNLSIQESLQVNKKKIYKHKSKYLKKNIQNIPLSQTLLQESTSKEKAFKPFWNKSVKIMSQKLWLPTKTDLLDLDLNSSNLFVNNIKQKSLYSVIQKNKNQLKTLQKTSCPLLQFSLPDITDQEKVCYTRKIRFYPNKQQLKLFNKCIGTSRFVYNNGVKYLNDLFDSKKKYFNLLNKNGCIFNYEKDQCCKPTNKSYFCEKHKNKKIKWNLPLTLPSLRKKVLVNNKNLKENELWQAEIPYDTRQLILKSLIGNIKACITNLKKNNITHFKLRFKNKKNKDQVFYCNKKSMKNFKMFKRKLKTKSRLRVRKKYKKYYNYTPESDYIIKKENNKWYIIFIKSKKVKYEKPKYNIVSLDPGVRTFQTFYSPSGICGELGKNLGLVLQKYYDKINLLKSKRTKKKGRTKKNMKNRISLLRTKVKNKITDFQWKTCSFLCKNFNKIMIPQLETKKLSQQKNRKLNKKTVKEMLSLNHYKFIEKLKYKCSTLSRKLIIVKEDYTSKTCTCCGFIKKDLGSKKIYKCNKCKLIIDRDLNGARNILLKNLGLDTIPQEN